MKSVTGRGRGKRRLLLAVALVLVAAGASAQSGMGVYGGLNLGFGQFGYDYEVKNWQLMLEGYRFHTDSYPNRNNAFVLTPVVGITPFRGHSNPLVDKLAFELQVGMQFGQKYSLSYAEMSATEIRPGVLAKLNFSFADWADLSGSSVPAWGDKLVTYAGLGFGIPIRTVKMSYSSDRKRLYESFGLDASDTTTTKAGFQILMECGLGFQINDKFSLNWTMAGLGFIGHWTYSMTLGANYHFR